MTPLDRDRHPRVHEPALNHLGLWMDDLAAAVDEGAAAPTTRIGAGQPWTCSVALH